LALSVGGLLFHARPVRVRSVLGEEMWQWDSFVGAPQNCEQGPLYHVSRPAHLSVFIEQLVSHRTDCHEISYLNLMHPVTGHEGTETGYMYNSTLSLTSALDGGGWSTPRPGRFTSEKDPVPIIQEAGWTPGLV
jgi:hypothetical protein